MRGPSSSSFDDDPLVNEFASLLALLEETRAEVDIENVEGRVIEFERRCEGTPAFSRPPALMS